MCIIFHHGCEPSSYRCLSAPQAFNTADHQNDKIIQLLEDIKYNLEHESDYTSIDDGVIVAEQPSNANTGLVVATGLNIAARPHADRPPASRLSDNEVTDDVVAGLRGAAEDEQAADDGEENGSDHSSDDSGERTAEETCESTFPVSGEFLHESLAQN